MIDVLDLLDFRPLETSCPLPATTILAGFLAGAAVTA